MKTVIRPYSASDALRSDRSAGDRLRHRQKVREAIRSNLAEIIAEEAILTKAPDRVVKVPIRGIKEYRFIYGENAPRVAAAGKAEVEVGQIVGAVQDQKGGLASAGDRPGLDYYETDITERASRLHWLDRSLSASCYRWSILRLQQCQQGGGGSKLRFFLAARFDAISSVLFSTRELYPGCHHKAWLMRGPQTLELLIAKVYDALVLTPFIQLDSWVLPRYGCSRGRLRSWVRPGRRRHSPRELLGLGLDPGEKLCIELRSRRLLGNLGAFGLKGL